MKRIRYTYSKAHESYTPHLAESLQDIQDATSRQVEFYKNGGFDTSKAYAYADVLISSDKVEDVEALWVESPQLALDRLDWYNFIVNVCLHVEKKRQGAGVERAFDLQEADKDDFVMDVYTKSRLSLKEYFDKNDKPNLTFKDAVYVVNGLAFQIFDAITYKAHRLLISPTIDNVTMIDDKGIEKVVNSAESLLADKWEKDYQRKQAELSTNFESAILTQKLERYMSADYQKQFLQLVSLRADAKAKMTRQQQAMFKRTVDVLTGKVESKYLITKAERHAISVEKRKGYYQRKQAERKQSKAL